MTLPWLTACDPETSESLVLRTASSPTQSVTVPIAAEATTTVTARTRGATAGDLGEVAYRTDREKRVFLFTEDLTTGASRSEVLELPVQGGAFGTSTFDVPALDTPKIVSARVYDTGLCSSYERWDDFAGPIVRGLYRALTSARFTVVGRTPGRRPRVLPYFTNPVYRPSTLTPVLRARGITSDEDSIRVRLALSADRFSGPTPLPNGTASCTNLDFEIDLDFGFRRVEGIYNLPPRCLGSEPGFAGPAPGTYDFVGELRQPPLVTVRTRPTGGGCDPGLTLARTPGPFEVSVPLELEATLTRDLPEAVRRALLDALLREPEAFGLPVRPCRCDIECTALAESPFGPITNPFGEGSGPRHRCLLGRGRRRCGVQLEADRIALRPDGVEVVLAEDETDPQHGTVLTGARFPESRALCAFGRTVDPEGNPPEFVTPPLPLERYDLPVTTVTSLE